MHTTRKNPMSRAGMPVLTVLALLAAILTTARAAGTCCVDATAGGANKGASWTDAYTNLQSALADAGCTEI